MKIFFVRHGLAENNIGDTYRHEINVSLTKHGMKQAKETGKALSKYGPFDLIISSPYLRTKQTAEIINKELNVKKIIYNDLIISQSSKTLIKLNNEKKQSIPEILNNKEFRIKFEKDVDFKEMIKYEKLTKLKKETTDPFELTDINENMKIIYAKMIKNSSVNPKNLYKNDMKFLKYLKTLKNKCILIVTHGGVISRPLQIITNTQNTEIKFIDKSAVEDDYKYYQCGNCCIMGWLYDNKEFKLIIPPNILHLKKFTLKEPQFYKDT